jgi:hypothetical protein
MELSPQVVCAFCPTQAIKLTEEHLWGVWISKLFPELDFVWASMRPETGDVSTGRMRSINRTVGAVCANCNNGWMSVLEADVQPIVSRIIKDGESMFLSRRDQRKLAAYTFKNAVIANYLNPSREPFFTRAARERFRASRQIPPSLNAGFAALFGSVTGLNHGYVLGLQPRTENRTWNNLEVYIYTFAIGHLVLQLRAFRFATIAYRGRPLPPPLPQNIFWNDYSVLFWPTANGSLRWPPTQYLSEDSFPGYTRRWEGKGIFILMY